MDGEIKNVIANFRRKRYGRSHVIQLSKEKIKITRGVPSPFELA